MIPEVAIGTVNFGLDYGVTNSVGQLSPVVAEALLSEAGGRGCSWIDTAAAYGAAEELIGVSQAARLFGICTKIGASGTNGVADLERELSESLRRLKRTKVDIVLLHRADLLRTNKKEILDWVRSEKVERNRIGAFGASLYGPEEAALALECELDWVQIPVSILNQIWLASGQLDNLRRAGIRIQARSLLAQGLVAVRPELLPQAFLALSAPLAELQLAAKESNLSAVEIALSFASAIGIDMAVIGVETVHQLRQCVDAIRAPSAFDWSRFACTDQEVIDPRNWPTGIRLR